STRPAPNRPINSCGNVFSISGTRIRFFFAASTPFLIASGTSRALPVPNPTWPDSSPTTTSAANERFLPPLTTFVTRLIEMTWSFRSKPCGVILCFGCLITLLSTSPLSEPYAFPSSVLLRLRERQFPAPLLLRSPRPLIQSLRLCSSPRPAPHRSRPARGRDTGIRRDRTPRC